MDVELVEAGIVAVSGELNLELQLVLGHGLLAHRASGTDAWPTPGAIRGMGGELTVLDRSSGMGWALCVALREEQARCQGAGRPGASASEPRGRQVERSIHRQRDLLDLGTTCVKAAAPSLARGAA